MHGCKTYLLQDGDGQICLTHSVSAGLDYSGCSPILAFLKDSQRAEFACATDGEALEAVKVLCQREGILPALEPAHALHHCFSLAKELGPGKDLLFMLSGRGDKDINTISKEMGYELGDREGEEQQAEEGK